MGGNRQGARRTRRRGGMTAPALIQRHVHIRCQHAAQDPLRLQVRGAVNSEVHFHRFHYRTAPLASARL